MAVWTCESERCHSFSLTPLPPSFSHPFFYIISLSHLSFSHSFFPPVVAHLTGWTSISDWALLEWHSWLQNPLSLTTTTTTTTHTHTHTHTHTRTYCKGHVVFWNRYLNFTSPCENGELPLKLDTWFSICRGDVCQLEIFIKCLLSNCWELCGWADGRRHIKPTKSTCYMVLEHVRVFMSIMYHVLLLLHFQCS